MADQTELPISAIRPPPDSPFYAPIRPEPSYERLRAPSSRVWVKNTSEAQVHIVIDKFNVGHELKPGEKREMEMLNDDIASFQRERLPGRMYPSSDPNKPDLPKPLHPILIEGCPSMVEDARKRYEERQAALYAEKYPHAKPPSGASVTRLRD